MWKLYQILQEYRPDLMLLPVNASPTGLLLIAGLGPANQVLHENYDQIIRKYSSDMDPPEEILKRTHVYTSDHPVISGLIQALVQGRSEKVDVGGMRVLTESILPKITAIPDNDGYDKESREELIQDVQFLRRELENKQKIIEDKTSMIASLEKNQALISEEYMDYRRNQNA